MNAPESGMEVQEGARDVPLHRKIAWTARELWEKYGRPEGRDRELWRAARRLVCGAKRSRQVAV